MTDEELASLQAQMYRDTVEIPEEMEVELIEAARDVANRLYFHPTRKTRFEYLGTKYACAYLSFITSNYKKVMYVVLDDLDLRTRTKAQVEVNNGLSEIENIRAVVASMLRHHTGNFEVGEVES